ncbi:MAG: energy transducer TonB [Sphingopyxis sp.]|uniref:energy transducer TonB n=1 Tax=Sphingopyxis sp. TaxID=1908224 RepID=UPI003D6D876A
MFKPVHMMALAGTLALAALPAAAQPQADVEGWSIVELPDYCALVRHYDDVAATNMIVALRADEQVTILLLSSTAAAPFPGLDQAVWQVGDSTYSGEGFVVDERGEFGQGIGRYFDDDVLAAFGSEHDLVIRRGDVPAARFSLAGSDKAVPAARECLAAVLAKMPPAVVPVDREAWLTYGDYPVIAKREGRGGAVGFRLSVAPDGSVAACETMSSSGHPDLDAATCALLTRRARFEPSDAGGFHESVIDWRLP